MLNRCPKCHSALFMASNSRDMSRAATAHCADCGGVWLSDSEVPRLTTFDTEAGLASVGGNPDSADGDRRTGLCPAGHGIMRRARVPMDDRRDFYLERCPHCRGIWFDAGELRAVQASEYAPRLGDLWDPVWRAAHRKAKVEERIEEALRQELGDELVRKLDELAGALREHPKRAKALAWFREQLSQENLPA